MPLATYLALSDAALNEAIASRFWQIPASSRDAPWFHHPDYCHNWFEAAKILSHIRLNSSPTTNTTTMMPPTHHHRNRSTGC